MDGNDDGVAIVHGRRLVMAGSNNYLGLANDPRVRDAAAAAIRTHGTSCTGSRVLNGNLRLHETLERELADFFEAEAALVFPTGYQANLGAIYGLVREGDHVFLDAAVHASLIDAARMSRGTVHLFTHNDADDLAGQLGEIDSSTPCLVVIDGVYSMEGDLAELPKIAAVCDEYGATLLLDDAHGAGVLADGRGTVAHFGGSANVPLRTLTFSKALASIGGAVLGPERVINYLRHHSRPIMFSAASTPAATAAALAALRVLREEPWRCARAIDIARRVRIELSALGFDVGMSETPVVPVLLGRPEDSELANQITVFSAYNRLLELGVYTNPILPPAASPRLRTSFIATHTDDQIKSVIEAFAIFAVELAGTGSPAIA
ncbi:aminotransferase class I/II-fold pyridoxal phosphate-dependent enzyme [Nocardia sp. NPDC052566]|uniref:aminotransferase class I/II-fold pyridoxal phosphate-dependent enzyme n=1 Tax=Nocardia sp. NPDC052566 TaxID=3364330 RepID=UPI0037CBC559